MPDHGEALGVDCFHLYKTAQNLMSVAAIYRETARMISLAEARWSSSPGESRIKPHPVVPEWTSACDGATEILMTTAANLEDTAHTLNRTADDYAATDQEAAAEFKRRREDDA